MRQRLHYIKLKAEPKTPTTDSVTNKPWEFDWGVKLPTQVVYYDEVRIGSSREEVDFNLNNPVD